MLGRSILNTAWRSALASPGWARLGVLALALMGCGDSGGPPGGSSPSSAHGGASGGASEGASSGALHDMGPTDDLPHVILISIDALRQDHLGAYGYERDTSPHIDRFAAEECVVFEDSYAVAPWTLISHMTMFTGLFPGQHGVTQSQAKLSVEVPTLAQRLAQRGYHTVGLFKEGWIHKRYGFDRGFAVFRDHDRLDDMQRHYQEEMERRPTDRPLFLFLHVWDVHCQDIGEPDSTVYDPPAPYDTLWVTDARERLEGLPAHDIYKAVLPATPAQREALVALYDGSIRYADQGVGDWIEEWREQGLLDNALVIITSDHGESLLQREGFGGHGQLHEEALRTPLIVRFPDGQGAGERRSGFTSQVDFLPTILAAAGLPIDDWQPGLDLAGELPHNRLLLFEREPHMGMVRWPWKLTWHADKGAQTGVLVNLDTDPGELDGLMRRDDEARFTKMQGRITRAIEHLRGSWAPVPGQVGESAPATPEEIAALKAVGYLGDN